MNKVNAQKSVKSIDEKVISNQFQIRSLKKLRDSLLPKFISGELCMK